MTHTRSRIVCKYKRRRKSILFWQFSYILDYSDPSQSASVDAILTSSINFSNFDIDFDALTQNFNQLELFNPLTEVLNEFWCKISVNQNLRWSVFVKKVSMQYLTRALFFRQKLVQPHIAPLMVFKSTKGFGTLWKVSNVEVEMIWWKKKEYLHSLNQQQDNHQQRCNRV